MTTWFSHISAVVGLSITAGALWWWHLKQPTEVEPIATFIGVAATLFFALVAIPIHWRFDENLKSKRLQKTLARRNVLDAVLDRIDGEMHHFQHIADGSGYTGDAHRRAVEFYSFKCLGEDLENIRHWWGYRRKVSPILVEIVRNDSLPDRHKDVSKIIPLLKKLRRQIERDLNSVGGSHEF